MIYKFPAPNLTHEIFASTPFSKYIKWPMTIKNIYKIKTRGLSAW